MDARLHSIFLTPDGESGVQALPPRISTNVESFKLQHPAFTHTLYGTDSGRAFLVQHFDSDTVAAFDELVPLAYKADLLRYCLLFEHGGIYADLSLYFFAPLVEVPGSGFVHVFRDGFGTTPWITSNSILGAPPREKVFEQCIRTILQNVRDRYYGADPLCPTGPNLFGRQLAGWVPPEMLICGETLRINRNPHVHCWAYVGARGDLVAVNYKRGGAGLASLGARSNSDYNVLYARKEIYRTELGRTSRWSAAEYGRRGFLRAAAGAPPGAVPERHHAGYAISGPYAPLGRGTYMARLLLAPSPGNAKGTIAGFLDVCCAAGRRILNQGSRFEVSPGSGSIMLEIPFSLDEDLEDVEVRLFLDRDAPFVFEALEMERT